MGTKILLSIITVFMAIYSANGVVNFLLIDKTIGLLFGIVVVVAVSVMISLITSLKSE
ncbi:MAG: hypothetical protein IJ759_07895 [Bacteroidales bacterium]|nr:hypothetical protein [Bacteroidales bacterium]MBR1775426.1 hypothetical protein [Bacteroidales bacterium]